MTTTKVAAAHLEPVLLDKAATIEKVLVAVADAARNGAELIAFPGEVIQEGAERNEKGAMQEFAVSVRDVGQF